MGGIEEMIRAIVAEELERRGVGRAEPAPLLMTIPRAAEMTGISADTLRAWIESGRLPRRTKNLDPNAKRPVFLVSPDEIKTATAKGPVQEEPHSLAARRLASRMR